MSTQNIFDMTDTWNAAGTTFNAIKMNVTDTASAAGSLLLDLQVGGTSQFRVSKGGRVLASDGVVATPAYSFAAETGSGLCRIGTRNIALGVNGTAVLGATDNGGNAIRLVSAALEWTTNIGNGGDLIVIRDAADTFAQRRSTNTQTHRLYSTYTASNNYQRMAITSARTTLSGLSGASVTATSLIPDGAVVVGVTTRVSTLIAGATGYQIGTVADPDRWGDITGTAVGTTSDNRDWTAGTIECFTSTSDVVITAKTSNFTAGAIEIAVHYLAGEAD